MCSGVLCRPRSKAPRKALPSTATTPRSSSPLALAKPAMNRRNAASNACGSSRRKTRLKVSWLGTPCCNCRTSRSSPSLDCPNVAMSEGPSAPHSVAARAMNKTSSNSCRALSALGSGNRRKAFLNFSIRLHLCSGSRPQNPSCVNLQYPPQIHMRFPCPLWGGVRGGGSSWRTQLAP